MSRLHLGAFLFVAALIWGLLLIVSGVSVSLAWLKPIGIVVGALSVVVACFDRWIWRLRLLHPWFVSIPDINGTWKGTLNSSWTKDGSGSSAPSIPAYLCVRQTFSAVRMRLMTKESASELLIGNVSKDGTAVLVVGVYRNTPDVLLRDRSPIHYGAILLHVQGDASMRLEGEYWTDRDTKGRMRFASVSPEHFDDFERASRCKYAEQKQK